MAIIIIRVKILILHNFASPKQLIEINKTFYCISNISNDYNEIFN